MQFIKNSGRDSLIISHYAILLNSHNAILSSLRDESLNGVNSAKRALGSGDPDLDTTKRAVQRLP